MPVKVAYLVSRFPKISETFILREMIALQNKGWDITLYPLILERQTIIHHEAKPWMQSLHYFPWLTLDVIASNLRALVSKPAKYISLWVKVVAGNIVSPKFLVRALLIFPKTIHIADDMVHNGVKHVHAHFATHPALAAWIIHNWTGLPYSVTAHAHDLYVDQTMLGTKLQGASFIITISEFNKEFLTHHIGNSVKSKIRIVRCGIDHSVYTRSEATVPADIFKICSVGSLQDYKGMRYLIEACAILQKRGVHFICQIVGGGEEYAFLSSLISQYGLQDVVKLLGAQTQDEVARILKNANCYVQPSVVTKSGKMEGIPVAIMEALSCGLPVIASSLSGIPELVRHGETGYLVLPSDAALLADAIEHVYRSPAEAARLGEAGRNLVLSEYSLDRNVMQVAELFEEIIKK